MKRKSKNLILLVTLTILILASAWIQYRLHRISNLGRLREGEIVEVLDDQPSSMSSSSNSNNNNAYPPSTSSSVTGAAAIENPDRGRPKGDEPSSRSDSDPAATPLDEAPPPAIPFIQQDQQQNKQKQQVFGSSSDKEKLVFIKQVILFRAFVLTAKTHLYPSSSPPYLLFRWQKRLGMATPHTHGVMMNYSQ